MAIITGPLDTRPGVLRLEGYRQALEAWGRPYDPALSVAGSFTFQSGYEATGALLGLDVRPDGIVAGNDLMAIGAIARLRERGVRVPEDVAIIGYDNAEIGRLYNPALSTISQPTYQLGFRGTELLLDRIEAMERDPEGGPPPPTSEVLGCELIVRRSSLAVAVEIDCGSIHSPEPWLACLGETTRSGSPGSEAL